MDVQIRLNRLREPNHRAELNAAFRRREHFHGVLIVDLTAVIVSTASRRQLWRLVCVSCGMAGRVPDDKGDVENCAGLGEEWTMFTDKADPLRRNRGVTRI